MISDEELSILSEECATRFDSIRKPFIGQYVICRSLNDGINSGWCIACDETGVVLKDARRLHYYHPKDQAHNWYEGVAISGLGSESRISDRGLKLITEDYSLTVCSDEAIHSITSYPVSPQT